MGDRRRRQEGAPALPWKMYKARFASVITFWFAQKNKDTFHRLNILTNCDCGQDSATHPAGRAYSVLPGPLAGFKGAASQRRRKGRVERVTVKGEKEGREGGERWTEKGGGRLHPYCKNFCGHPRA